GLCLSRELSVHDLAGDFFVGARGIEGITARQVDQFDGLTARQDKSASPTLDRHTGIVGDFLPRAGQDVEQRALPRIRIADQRGGTKPAHDWSSTSIALAWARRTATVILPIVSAMGSRPPKIPRCAISTIAPSSMPSARSRFA